MNFLAIDTSGKHLTVLAQKGEKTVSLFERDCALRHSVLVMDKIDEALSRADLRPAECDFFAAVVGPGSFTGIRIGISTVKGLCLACGKPAL
ncbi:MAG: tRNA (adenosine(37)-N6)-threonylcarbamoyltransferase complex dimerization subunit type 1 TsaB, partial [Candidatus Gallimonas sp.]